MLFGLGSAGHIHLIPQYRTLDFRKRQICPYTYIIWKYLQGSDFQGSWTFKNWLLSHRIATSQFSATEQWAKWNTAQIQSRPERRRNFTDYSVLFLHPQEPIPSSILELQRKVMFHSTLWRSKSKSPWCGVIVLRSDGENNVRLITDFESGTGYLRFFSSCKPDLVGKELWMMNQ